MYFNIFHENFIHLKCPGICSNSYYEWLNLAHKHFSHIIFTSQIVRRANLLTSYFNVIQISKNISVMMIFQHEPKCFLDPWQDATSVPTPD